MLPPPSATLPAGDHQSLGAGARPCPAFTPYGSLQGQAKGFGLWRLAQYHLSQFCAVRTFGFSVSQWQHTWYLG